MKTILVSLCLLVAVLFLSGCGSTPAPAPEAHIDAITTDGHYLQTSPELCMKQLLAAGFPRIFQICKCFRQNERGRKHLP